MGMNMYGFFETPPINNDSELQELKEKLALTDRKKKSKKKINFERIGENMLPRVRRQDLPWM